MRGVFVYARFARLRGFCFHSRSLVAQGVSFSIGEILKRVLPAREARAKAFRSPHLCALPGLLRQGQGELGQKANVMT